MIIKAGYFSDTLKDSDPEVFEAIIGELRRQSNQIELIASENFVSQASLEALGSVMTNKTVEGYPGHRYYGGAGYADIIETLAIQRACQLFRCKYANVQPHSGSQANLAVFAALLEPTNTILSMELTAGGHLSHGSKANVSGKWFNVAHYGVSEAAGLIDMTEVERLAKEYKPKLLICGGSAYSRTIDFGQFREIADSVGAWLLVDMAHFAGLVAGGQYLDPFPHAHVATATTYKNLRGARGGLILWNDDDLSKKINEGVFPGVQGSVMLNAIAAKAVCLGEALKPGFRDYASSVLANARALASTLITRGVDVVSGGTDTPLLLINLMSLQLTGDAASEALERAGLTCNKNSVPGDTTSVKVTSGLRLGVSAGTARGFSVDEFCCVGNWIADILLGLAAEGTCGNISIEKRVRQKTLALCQSYPIYPSQMDYLSSD